MKRSELDEPEAPGQEELRAALETIQRAGFRTVQELGWHVQPNDFYSPLNDCSFLAANPDLWVPFESPEIDWRLPHQLGVAAEVATFVDELRDVPASSEKPGVYCWMNPFWNGADAIVQYGLLRARKPGRVVEIGCGWSSLLMARALERNEMETGIRPEVTLVEPNPRAEISRALPRPWTQLRAILQRTPLSICESLGHGDVLFFDGSHCAKVASDVCWFFFHVLPRLQSGVLIHLHDIFLPGDYPADWIFERGQTWNEQYVLQAFLMHNRDYEVEIANAWLAHHCHQQLAALYKDVQPARGVSFWMRKR